MTNLMVIAMTEQEVRKRTSRGFDPDDDGITHINVHPSPKQARTMLGQNLSSFKYMPFFHPYYGNFCSLEGFWHYLYNKERDDKLRHLAHDRAYRYGKRGTPDPYKDFQEDIVAGMYIKILHNERLCTSVRKCDLPFDMYYQFGPGGVIISPKESDWLVAGLEEIREALKNDVVPEVWRRSEERYMRGELRR